MLDPETREAVRRAVGLLTASVNDWTELDNPDWVWSMMGEDADERFGTLQALLSIFPGIIEGIGEDPVEVIQFMASSIVGED